MGGQLALERDGVVLVQVPSIVVPERGPLHIASDAVSIHGLSMLSRLERLVDWYVSRFDPRCDGDTRDLGFVRGFMIAMPISLVMWFIIAALLLWVSD